MDGVWTLGSIEREIDDLRTDNLIIVDPEGWVRWALPLGRGPDVDVTLEADGNLLYGGGYIYDPTVIGIDGHLVWKGPAGDEGDYTHHMERLPDGNLLTLVDATDAVGDATWRGFRVEVLDGETGDIVWKWSSEDAVAAGWLPAGDSPGEDVFHANSVTWIDDDEGPAVWVSLRSLSRIIRIDRDTGEMTWAMGRDQDFRLIDDEGNDGPLADWFYGQHAPEVRLPFLYAYDNGWSRPTDTSFSRAVKFELDMDQKTARVAWSWTEPGWYEPIWGDIDELPGGHVLITKGHCAECGSHGVSEIVEIDPATNEVVWRAQHPEAETGTYRHERIAGCDLFHNAKYCPELLE
jgi:hypothetical protein